MFAASNTSPRAARLPDFLIIGAQKAGSTFVLRCLGGHPQIFMPRYEVAVFEDPFYSAEAIVQLGQQLAPAPENQLTGIKRPDYLARPECPTRIRQHMPHAKLIVVLRDPVVRAISAYYWYMQVGYLPVRAPAEGLQAILDGAYDQTYPRAQDILNYGFYHAYLSRYLDYFPRRQLFVAPYTDLQTDAAGVINRMYAFLGVAPHNDPHMLQKQSNQSAYSLLRLRWLAFASRTFLYERLSYGSGQIALRLRESRLARWAYLACLAGDRYLLSRLLPNQKPTLPDSLLQQLRQLYADDWQQMQTWLATNPTMAETTTDRPS